MARIKAEHARIDNVLWIDHPLQARDQSLLVRAKQFRIRVALAPLQLQCTEFAHAPYQHRLKK